MSIGAWDEMQRVSHESAVLANAFLHVWIDENCWYGKVPTMNRRGRPVNSLQVVHFNSDTNIGHGHIDKKEKYFR